jgi:hypothetical protein
MQTLRDYPEVELGEIVLPVMIADGPPQGPEPPPPPPPPPPQNDGPTG